MSGVVCVCDFRIGKVEIKGIFCLWLVIVVGLMRSFVLKGMDDVIEVDV